MKRSGCWLVAFICLVATPVLAHDVEHHAAVVIDTDMGLDDAVALALALQNPRVNIVALVACEGAAGGERGVEHLERMLHLFNRREIPLYAPAARDDAKAPPFRDFAEESVGSVLPTGAEPIRRSFSPDAYVSERGRTVILALGPLTNIAAALQAKPEIRKGIAKVIFAGTPDANKAWNARFDPGALATVQAAGVPLEYVVPGERAGRKPAAWRKGELTLGQGTSIGEDFFNRLLALPRVRQHYLEGLESFTDELAFLYLVDDGLFWGQDQKKVYVPNNHVEIANAFVRLLSDGRQHKGRVVFVDGTLPDTILQEDVRERKAAIIAKNGEAEWFAQLLMNELHDHLGVYSVIGVKMGLRAAEWLNAPQHAMKVTSRVPARPPMSCINDGLIVSTGSTPGRTLFTHKPAATDVVEVSFEYNRRAVTLRIQPEYRERIKTRFRALLDQQAPGDHEYWHGVREVGLDVWENWHRRDLFEVIDASAECK
jgi:inosine-uridine nucleoside N-ribohydrolase